MSIRDERLYRHLYGSFESYCEKSLGMSRGHAYRLIASADIAKDLETDDEPKVSPRGDSQPSQPATRPPAKPRNEKQLRPLASLDKGQRKKAWAEATELTRMSGRNEPTAGEVKVAAEEHRRSNDKAKEFAAAGRRETANRKARENPPPKDEGPIVLSPPEGYLNWFCYAEDQAMALLKAKSIEDDVADIALRRINQLGRLLDRVYNETRDQRAFDRGKESDLRIADEED